MPVLLAFATVVSTALGGLLALRHRDRLHLILGFTAGVLLGLVAFDLLPEIFAMAGDSRLFGLPSVSLALVAGFLLLHLLEHTLGIHESHTQEYGEHHHHAPTMGLAAAGTLVAHSFLDGMAIGIAFHTTTALGWTVALAVIAHDFSDGLNTVSLMLRHGNNEWRARIMLALDALAPMAGAATALLITVPDKALAHYLAFFAGFLLYLATSDILPEAHARHPGRLTMLATVGGVVFIGTVVALS